MSAFLRPGTSSLTLRLGDVALACAGIAVTLPLMAIVALAIKLDSPGPVFSREKRLLVGRVAMVLKFRTVPHHPQSHQSARGEPIFTRVGRLLHYTRIDVLPQLVNVLRGDMALIGGGRTRPDFIDQ
jgi:lipopolysaccharide/colanic/teichoic acid biosynthesis glycosyltransferase